MNEVLDLRNLMKTSDIVRPIKLVTIEAEILYPMIGWYEARPYSLDYGMFAPLTGAQIRGLWRWWMRTALATLRCGQTTIEEMDKEIGKLLGSTRNSSRFWIVVRENEEKRAEMEEFARKLKEKLKEKFDEEVGSTKREEENPTKIEEEIRKAIAKKSGESLENVDKILGEGEVYYIEPKIKIPLQNYRQDSLKVKSGEKQAETSEIKAGTMEVLDIELHTNEEDEGKGRGSDGSKKERNRIEVKLELKPIDKELSHKLETPRIRLITQPMEGEKKKEIKIEKPSDLKRASNEIVEGFERYFDRVIEHVVIPLAVFNKFESREVEIDLYYLPTVEDEPIESCVPFALASLLTALLLDGVGGIKNRGFGSVIVKEVRVEEEGLIAPSSATEERIIREIKELQEFFMNKIINKKDHKEIEKGIIKLLKEKLLKYTKRCFPTLVETGCGKGLPEVPCLCIDEGYFRVEAIETGLRKTNIPEILHEIGQSTMKLAWKGSPREKGYLYHTWILGLPRKSWRHVGRGKKKPTGYWVDFGEEKHGEERRQSSISLTLFVPKERDSDNIFIIMKGFLTSSSDWFYRLGSGESRLMYNSSIDFKARKGSNISAVENYIKSIKSIIRDKIFKYAELEDKNIQVYTNPVQQQQNLFKIKTIITMNIPHNVRYAKSCDGKNHDLRMKSYEEYITEVFNIAWDCIKSKCIDGIKRIKSNRNIG